MYRFNFALLWAVSIIPSAFSDCYQPDGGYETSSEIIPCPNSTICCALNRKNFPGGNTTRDGPTRDECLSNGLCQNRVKLDNGKEDVSFWRDFCADKDWKSGNCLNVCTEGGNGNARMTPCDGTAKSKKWCCSDNTDCCNTQFFVTLDAVFKATGPPLFSSMSTSSSATATTPLPSPSSSSTASHSTTTSSPSAPKSTTDTTSVKEVSSSSNDLSAGAKVGIAIGAIIGALVFFGLGFVVAKYPQWGNKHHAQDDAKLPTYAEHRVAPVEMGVQAHEMHGGYGAELATHGYGSKTSLKQ